MTVLYDGTIYNSQLHGGISRYFTGLIEALAALEPGWRFEVHLNRGPAAPLPAAASVRICRRRHFRPRMVFYPLNAVSRIVHARRARPGLIHSTLYRPLRFVPGAPLVVTIHDLVAHIRRDLYGPAYNRFRRWIEWSARHASAILTVSEASRHNIVRLLRVTAEKVHVTYPGVAPVFTPALPEEIRRFRELRGLGRPYVLYVGHRGEHKNFGIVESAFRLPELGGIDLFAPGGGDLSDAELRCAYCGAAALVFPSVHEGFGFPLVEAMACGTPIAASDIPTNREIAGDACVTFDPADPHACAQAILNAAGPARERLLAAAAARRSMFSWSACAARTLEVYREVLGR